MDREGVGHLPSRAMGAGCQHLGEGLRSWRGEGRWEQWLAPGGTDTSVPALQAMNAALAEREHSEDWTLLWCRLELVVGVRPWLSVSVGGQRCWGVFTFISACLLPGPASEKAWEEQLPSRKGLLPIWILAAEDQPSPKGPTPREDGWWQGCKMRLEHLVPESEEGLTERGDASGAGESA